LLVRSAQLKQRRPDNAGKYAGAARHDKPAFGKRLAAVQADGFLSVIVAGNL
jgi:hypothetical protein